MPTVALATARAGQHGSHAGDHARCGWLVGFGRLMLACVAGTAVRCAVCRWHGSLMCSLSLPRYLLKPSGWDPIRLLARNPREAQTAKWISIEVKTNMANNTDTPDFDPAPNAHALLLWHIAKKSFQVGAIVAGKKLSAGER